MTDLFWDGVWKLVQFNVRVGVRVLRALDRIDNHYTARRQADVDAVRRELAETERELAA